MGARARAPIAIVVGLLVALLLVPSAQADKFGFAFKETFGSSAQPSFSRPLAMTVDPATGDLLVVDASAKTISRFKPNGEADNFSALGTNTIDGKGGADKTPQEGLSFPENPRSTQLAIDRSGGTTDGDIYVTQESKSLVDVFSAAGAYLGQITEFTSDEIQKLEFTGFSNGDDFTLGNLPGSCSGSSTAQLPYDFSTLGADLKAALAGKCGPNFAVKTSVSVNVEFTAALGHANQPQTGCERQSSGVGFCAASTIVQGDATHNEVQKVEFEEFSPGDRFNITFLPKCSAPFTGSVVYSASLSQSILAALEEKCGANFAVSSPTATATIEFANALSIADQPQLSCAVESGGGSCAASTAEGGGKAKPLGRACGVTADSSGNVYVGDFDNSLIHKYVPGANPVANADNTANLARRRAAALAAGTGPAAGFLFSDSFGAEPVKLDSATGEQKYVVATGDSIALAVNPADGTLSSAGSREVTQYDASGAAEATRLAHYKPGGGNLQGIAVDPTTGNAYLSRDGEAKIAVYERVPLPEATSEAATGIGGQTAILHGTLDPRGGPPASCEFQYTTEATFDKQGFSGAQSAKCSPAGPFSGSGPQAVSATLEGLAPGTAYVFRLRAENKGGSTPEVESKDGALSFATLGPAIAEEAIGEIGETEATIEAQLNPKGEATTYAVEYVSEAEYQSSGYNNATTFPVPPAGAGSGSKFLAVSVTLEGLEPDSAYHARLAAANAGADVRGPDLRFATYPPAEGLPDGRAWEKVTPAAKGGEAIPPEPNSLLGGSCRFCLPGINNTTLPMQASPDGEAVLYGGQPFAEGLAAGANEYLSGRTAGGWDWQSLSTPTTTGTWQAFSEDLSRGVLAQTEPALSPQAPSKGGSPFANLYLQAEGGSPQPLVLAAPPNRDAGNTTDGQFRLRYSAANAGTAAAPAFTHIAFEANDALTAAVSGAAPAAPPVTPEANDCSVAACNLYEWTGGQLRLINVAPGNAKAVGKATIGSGRLLAEVGPQYESPNTDNAVSADGSRVFWSSGETGHAYARLGGAKTLEVPGPATCKAGEALAARACFLTASVDGERVLLSNGQIDALNEAETAYEKTFDLTNGKGGFQGILGTSEDLSRVYFVDTAALTPEGEANENGEHAEAGKSNLYAWQEGSLAFIGALASSDRSFVLGSYGTWKAAPSGRTAQASADGRFLAFMSKATLTGYDNRPRGGEGCEKELSGSPCFEVFEYDAASSKLICPSCNPSGRPPLAGSHLSLIRPGGVAPPFPQLDSLSAAGEGRLFFESGDRLSAGDENGLVQDVYEYEPEGVGSCSRVGGCVELISSGQGANDSMFLDSTPSGDDAFFITRSQLLPSDRDEQLDLYDARVGGGFEEEETVPCEGEACKGPVTNPPEAPGAGSPGFVGPGNPTPPAPCPKGKVRRGGKCVKPHGRHHKHRRHGKRAAKHKRGAHR